MRFSATVSALAFAAVALAQDQIVKVGEVNGKMSLAFSPANITATKGSVITFIFDGTPGNHTIAQSTFPSPCTPDPNGFDSGYFATPAGGNGPFGVWNLTVTDETKPIWFYCAQVKPAVHCTAGMVGSINAPTNGTNTFEAFQKAAEALASTAVVQPSIALVGQGASASTSAQADSTATVPPTSGASSPTGGSSSGSGSKTSSSGSMQTSPSSAGSVTVNGFAAMVAAAFGVALL